MKCPNCGGKATGKFCPFCGVELPDSESPNSNKNKATRTTVTTKVEKVPVSSRRGELPPQCISPKNRVITLILNLFLGLFGGHHFYVGRWGMGLLYLFTFGLFGIGTFIDFVLILFGAFKDSDEKYIVNWS